MISNRKDLVEIEGENRAETPLSVLIFDGGVSAWIPKSQMEDWPDEGEFGTFLMKEWIAIKKGLI